MADEDNTHQEISVTVRYYSDDDKAPNLYTTLGRNCRSERMRWNISASMMAELVGIPTSQLLYIEAGKGNPTLKTLTALAIELRCSVTELLTCVPMTDPIKPDHAGR
jgi:DNA-binding XRE family transcriptional regulator